MSVITEEIDTTTQHIDQTVQLQEAKIPEEGEIQRALAEKTPEEIVRIVMILGVVSQGLFEKVAQVFPEIIGQDNTNVKAPPPGSRRTFAREQVRQKRPANTFRGVLGNMKLSGSLKVKVDIRPNGSI